MMDCIQEMSTQQLLKTTTELESLPRLSADDSETTLVSIKSVKKRSRKQPVSENPTTRKSARQSLPDNKAPSKKGLLAESLGGNMASSIVSAVPDVESIDLFARLKHAKALSYQKPNQDGRMTKTKVVTSTLRAQGMA
jgi:hypothetical protein